MALHSKSISFFNCFFISIETADWSVNCSALPPTTFKNKGPISWKLSLLPPEIIQQKHAFCVWQGSLHSFIAFWMHFKCKVNLWIRCFNYFLYPCQCLVCCICCFRILVRKSQHPLLRIILGPKKYWVMTFIQIMTVWAGYYRKYD